jgi:galactokinase/mevalonate kinase-like predicted kinase
MLTLWPRPDGYNVLSDTHINPENVKKLAEAAEAAWEGLTVMDFKKFTQGFLDSFHSQVRMFPKMMNPEIEKIIDSYKEVASAWKLSGAGGGGYLILISEENISNAFKIKIRVKDLWL